MNNFLEIDLRTMMMCGQLLITDCKLILINEYYKKYIKNIFHWLIYFLWFAMALRMLE